MYLRILNKIKSKLPLIGIIVILVATAFLRLYNLGYSDYIKDEHRTFYDSRYAGTFWEFALDQRKGPMQYLVAFVPKMFAGNFSNEYAQRLPFALFNIVSVYIFYLLVKRFTGDERVGLTASGLYAVNGFISGFGRIAQYQNLNLLFSFLALYFFYDMAFKVINNIRNAILGILFLVFSSLSHWDAIFIVVPVMYLWAVFLRSRLLSSRTKVMSIISTTLIFLAMILPFLVPYTQSQLSNAGNQSYLDRRVGLFQGRDLEFDFLIKLYNPFITYYLYIFLGLLGAIFIKRSWVFILWFLVDYLLFYFMCSWILELLRQTC